MPGLQHSNKNPNQKNSFIHLHEKALEMHELVSHVFVVVSPLNHLVH